MKFTIKRAVFLDMLRKIAPVIPAKATLPVMTYVLVETQDSFLRVYGFGFESSMITVQNILIEEIGKLCLPFKPLLDLVSSFSGDTVTLTANLERSTAAIQCGETHVNLKGLQAEEFPPFPWAFKVVENNRVGDVLEKIAQYVAFAASAETERPVLNAVRLEIASNHLSAVATDGFRLAYYFTNIKTDGPAATALVPVKAILEAAKLKNPTIWIEEGKFFAADDYTTLMAALIDGSYPQYDAIIPKTTTSSVTFSAEAMLRALRQSRVLSVNQLITLCYEKKEDQDGLLVESQSEESGDLSAWLPCAIYGNLEPLALNVNYFMDALKAVETGDVMLQANRANMPVKLVMPDSCNWSGTWTTIIMPMLRG